MLWLCVLAGLVGAVLSQNYQLVWNDEFDFIDLNKWQYEVTAWGGGNGEFEVYTPDPTNSYCSNGILYILPTRTIDNTNPLTGQPFGPDYLVNGVMDLNAMYGTCTNSENSGCYRTGSDIPPVMSARLRSYQRFSFTYGRVEWRAKMPAGDWLWPALWLLPEDWVYGGWPMSGEMDMVEGRGNRDLKVDGADIGIQEAASTMHWGATVDQNRFWLTSLARRNYTYDYASDFHIYVLDWSTNGIRFIIDDVALLDVPYPLIDQNPNWTGFWDFGAPWNAGTQDPWVGGPYPLLTPFDQNFHFLMNVAAGGTNGYFPDNAVNQGGAAPKPWVNGQAGAMQSFWAAESVWYPTWQGDSAAMQVDYIRVYQEV